MIEQELSRRSFLKNGTLVTGLALIAGSSFGMPSYIKNLGKPNSLFKGVQVGVISYSWRSMPSSAEQVLQYCIDSNLSAIELMGPSAESFAGAPEAPTRQGKNASDEQKAAYTEYISKLATWRAKVPMAKFEQLGKMYKKAGVSIYAYKPSALDSNSTDAEVDYAFRAAKAMGASHATVELPKDAARTQKLGDIAKRNKVYCAYHGHTQQTPTWWDEALSQSPYNALNLDMGHYVAAGYDPVELINAKHTHIKSMHTKDRKSKENGGANLPWGEGDTPIVQVLELMRDKKYKFPATIELEYDIPAGSDAVKETAKCCEYARKALGA